MSGHYSDNARPVWRFPEAAYIILPESIVFWRFPCIFFTGSTGCSASQRVYSTNNDTDCIVESDLLTSTNDASLFQHTRRKLPAELAAKLAKSKEANTGLLNKRQLLFALFDQEIHASDTADTVSSSARCFERK